MTSDSKAIANRIARTDGRTDGLTESHQDPIANSHFPHVDSLVDNPDSSRQKELEHMTSPPIPGAHLVPPISRDDLELLGIPDDPRIIGLFEGYGGLTLGVKAAIGGELVAYSEIEPSSLRLLAEHFPGVPNLGDVTHADWSSWVGKVDVMLGGFPCQDVSHAGLGAGLMTGTRSGLWYQFARGIAETRPALVVIENVRGLRSAPAGIKEWNDNEEIDLGELTATTGDMEPLAWDLGEPIGSGRPVLRALGAVLGDLAELGYVGGYASVPASAVGAPHGRERVFIVAVPE